jgi:hypothetical protein
VRCVAVAFEIILKIVKNMERDKRYTPPELFEDLKRQTGVNFKRAMDPAPINPKKDGLKRKWRAKSVYLNPPFSELKKWVEYAMVEYKSGRIKNNLAIVVPWYAFKDRPNAVTSPQKYLKNLSPKPTKVYRGYYKFIKPSGEQYKTGFECYILVWLR